MIVAILIGIAWGISDLNKEPPAYLPTIEKKTNTTNATPSVVYSVPVPQNSAYVVIVRLLVYRADYSSARGGTTIGVFVRGAGNIAQSGTLVNQLSGLLTGATVTMTANTGTQRADITVTGIAATNLNWNLSIDVLVNT